MPCCIPYRRPGEGVLAPLYSQTSTLIINMRKHFAYLRKINSTKPFCQMLLQIPLVLLDKLRSQSRSFIKRILSLHDIRYVILTFIHFFSSMPSTTTDRMPIHLVLDTSTAPPSSIFTRAQLVPILSLYKDHTKRKCLVNNRLF